MLLLLFLDAYNYGYEIGPDGQFHHEIHGEDGVTYGCYGYVDPFGELKATFYISDGWGYRVVRPGEDIELFLHEHEHHHGDSDSNSHNHDHDNNHSESDHHEHHGIITPWRNLKFPKDCRQFENTGVIRPTRPSVPSKPGNIYHYLL